MSEAGPLVFLLLALVVFWLLVMRPARVQQKKMRQMQSQLAVGQEIVLSAGIFGVIRSLGESRAEIEIAPGTVITVARQVVVRRADELPPESDVAETAPGSADVPGDEPGPTAPARQA